jgi:glucosamine--fructose-6-phosphate aminotransferase (isomerizing)
MVQQSGPEIGVAATKTFTSQLSVFAQLALRVAKIRGKIGHTQIEELEGSIHQIPDIVEQAIETNNSKALSVAKKFKEKPVFFFLGRGISSATAQEARLKLMEIAYVPSIAYPAGESKHGPISLIEPGFPVIFVCPKDNTRKMIIGNVMEMKARGASIISVIEKGDEEIKNLSDEYFEIPGNMPGILSPIAFVVPMQLFAYYMAVEKGQNPDKPRNLAKCVTVK